MAFKEKSQKEILALTKDEQIKYWTDFKNYVNEKKREITKKKREQEKIFAERNRKELNHARFVAFGAIAKLPNAKQIFSEISKNEFSENDCKALNKLMKALKFEDVKFENVITRS